MVVRLKGAKANGMKVDEAYRLARAALRAEERERCEDSLTVEFRVWRGHGAGWCGVGD